MTLNVGNELTAMSTQTEEVVNPDGRDFALRIIYPEAGKFEEILITRISMKYSGEWVAQLEGGMIFENLIFNHFYCIITFKSEAREWNRSDGRGQSWFLVQYWEQT